jgi:hypothetical protein
MKEVGHRCKKFVVVLNNIKMMTFFFAGIPFAGSSDLVFEPN